jgi:hypothetical protein
VDGDTGVVDLSHAPRMAIAPSSTAKRARMTALLRMLDPSEYVAPTEEDDADRGIGSRDFFQSSAGFASQTPSPWASLIRQKGRSVIGPAFS